MCVSRQKGVILHTAEKVARNVVFWVSQKMFFEGSLPLSVNNVFTWLF